MAIDFLKVCVGASGEHRDRVVPANAVQTQFPRLKIWVGLTVCALSDPCRYLRARVDYTTDDSEWSDFMSDSSVVAQGYDAVYEATPRSPTLWSIWKEQAAGEDYPDEFSHISFVSLSDLRTLKDSLDLQKESNFADLACGMGGPALWVAKETGAALTGVDFSAQAIAQATRRAEALGMSSQARFVVGSFASTGLDNASIDAVMSIDALQYAPDKAAAIREFARILRPGGRLVFYSFELHADRAQGLPVIGEDMVSDFRPLLEQNQFEVLTYQETPGWHERLTEAYSAVIAAQDILQGEMGLLATAAMLSEMTLTLQRDLYSGRVFVIAARRGGTA